MGTEIWRRQGHTSDLAALFALVFSERGAGPTTWVCSVCGADVDSRAGGGIGLGEHVRRHLDA